MNRKIIPRCPFDDEILDAQYDRGTTRLLSERIESLRPLVEKLDAGRREFDKAEKIAEELRTLVGDYPPLVIAHLLVNVQQMQNNASKEEYDQAEKAWVTADRLFVKFNGSYNEAWRQVELAAHAWEYQDLAVKGVAKEVLEGKEREGGRKGGLACKRKLWAEKTAARMVKEMKGCTEDQAWEKIPSSSKPWVFEFREFDVEVYRDGDKLMAENSATQIPIGKGELKKSSFFKQYYKPAKNSGK